MMLPKEMLPKDMLSVAEKVIKNQADLIIYLNTYIAYLNDSISEKEFMKLAEESIKEKEPFDEENVLHNFIYLKHITPHIDLDDFSAMMNYDTEKVLDYFEKMRKNISPFPKEFL